MDDIVSRFHGPHGDWCVTFSDGGFTTGLSVLVGYNQFVGRRWPDLIEFGQALAAIGLSPACIDPRSAVGQMLAEAGRGIRLNASP